MSIGPRPDRRRTRRSPPTRQPSSWAPSPAAWPREALRLAHNKVIRAASYPLGKNLTRAD